MTNILHRYIVFKDDDDVEIERFDTTGVQRDRLWVVKSNAAGTTYLHFYTRFLGGDWEIPEGQENIKKLGGLRWALHFKRDTVQ